MIMNSPSPFSDAETLLGDSMDMDSLSDGKMREESTDLTAPGGDHGTGHGLPLTFIIEDSSHAIIQVEADYDCHSESDSHGEAYYDCYRETDSNRETPTTMEDGESGQVTVEDSSDDEMPCEDDSTTNIVRRRGVKVLEIFGKLRCPEVLEMKKLSLHGIEQMKELSAQEILEILSHRTQSSGARKDENTVQQSDRTPPLLSWDVQEDDLNDQSEIMKVDNSPTSSTFSARIKVEEPETPLVVD